MSGQHASAVTETKTLSWQLRDGVLELALHQPPCNEIGTALAADLERFAEVLESSSKKAAALIARVECVNFCCAFTAC